MDSPPPIPTLSGNRSVGPNVDFPLSWTAAFGNTHYIVLQNKNFSGVWTQIPESPVSGSGVVLKRTLGNYEFAVEACRGSQCSAPSASVTVIVCQPNNC